MKIKMLRDEVTIFGRLMMGNEITVEENLGHELIRTGAAVEVKPPAAKKQPAAKKKPAHQKQPATKRRSASHKKSRP